jgi:nucleotide-binding universal stress UspA family protein
MTGVRRILVPTNFSEDSASGLKYAASLAEETQAEIVVLHVAQRKEADAFLGVLAAMEGAPVLYRPAGMPVDRLLRERMLDLYRFIEKAIRNPGRLTIRRKVALGNKEEKIVETANAERIDLVVLAMRKRSFLSHLMARQKLLKMIARFPCPVLLKMPFLESWHQSGVLRFAR